MNRILSRQFHGGPYTQIGFDGDIARIEQRVTGHDASIGFSDQQDLQVAFRRKVFLAYLEGRR